MHPANQRAKVGVAERIRACDVAGVACKFGAGIDKKRMAVGRRVLLQDLVMQHRRAFVQRDDRVVRQFLLAQSACLEEGKLYLELRGTSFERPGGCKMPAGTESARLPQARQLVRALRGALVIEVPHEACRVDRAHPPAHELRERLSDVGHAAQIPGQQRPHRAALGYRADVKMSAPVGLRQVGRLVPVVGRPVEEKLRPAARLEVHERVRCVRERCPHLEGRIDLERIGPVVLEDGECRSGVHQQRAVAAGLERACGPAADRRQVRSKAGTELGCEVPR